MIETDNGEQVTGGELVGRYWPYDGPHTAEGVTDAARALTELVRYLNNATGPGNGRETLRYAPHIYRTLGALYGALAGMEQLLTQISTELERIAVDPTTYDDRHTVNYSAESTAYGAAHSLGEAREALGPVGHHLGRAWGDTSHLGHNLGSE